MLYIEHVQRKFLRKILDFVSICTLLNTARVLVIYIDRHFSKFYIKEVIGTKEKVHILSMSVYI